MKLPLLRGFLAPEMFKITFYSRLFLDLDLVSVVLKEKRNTATSATLENQKAKVLIGA